MTLVGKDGKAVKGRDDDGKGTAKGEGKGEDDKEDEDDKKDDGKDVEGDDDDDDDEDEEDATETQDLMLEEEEAHLRSASKTHADLDSGEVDKCYQEWLQSAVAAKVKAFLEAEL